MPKRRTLRPGTRGEALLGALFGFLFGYMVSEGILSRYMHPLHWVSAAMIALIAYLGTLMWYRWRYPLRRSIPSGNRQPVAKSRWWRWWKSRRRD
jgi:hypothetical protein